MYSKLKTTIFWFIIIQPFLDIFYLYQPPISTILKFSPATMLRIILVGIISILFLWSNKNKKMKLFLGIYMGLLIVYFIGHHLNAMQFHSLVDGNFGYSITRELFYLIRMVLPLIILVVSYNVKFTDNQLESIISWLVALISGSIVVTNLFKISLASYTNQRITGSIINWFFDNRHGSYFQLASKGFFNFANSTAAVEVLLLPVMLYYLIKHTNVKNFLLSLVQVLAMFMLGTKVSTLGCIGIVILMTGMYLFCTLIKRDLVLKKSVLGILLLFIMLCGIIYPVSPAINRTNFDAQIQQERDGDKAEVKKREKKLEEKSKKGDSKKEINKHETPLIRYIRKHYSEYSINARFIEVSYPYYDDPGFWKEIMKWPIQDRISFRKIEIAMLNRVKEVNDNPKDELFGITYTRMNNIFNVERDFISQYYSMGILGVILLILPYILGVIYLIYAILRHFRTKFTFRNTSFLLGILGILSVSLYSGNVMDFLTATFILAFIEGQLLARVKTQTFSEQEKISLLMPTYNDQETILESLESIRNQTYTNWELIIIDDGSTDNTKQVVNDYINRFNLEHKVRYLYESNSDQLNALKLGLKYLSGTIVYIIHSDDIFSNRKVLSRAIHILESDDIDGILADISIDNGNHTKIKKHSTLDYLGNSRQLKIQTLWLGRNLYLDFAFWRTPVFKNQVRRNYLSWNTPNWINLQDELINSLNLENANFSVINYRVHDGNYINSEVGNLNVLNGELRTLVSLLSRYQIPSYQFQYRIFRIFNKLNLLSIYWPVAFKGQTTKKAVGEIVGFAVSKRVPDFNNQPYLKALIAFYKADQDRTVDLKIPVELPIYYGSDMRQFNQKMINGTLEPFYGELFEEMQKGFTKIKVSKEDVAKWQVIIQFLNIKPYVDLEVRN
ncbi:O-antigen ligase family protein [Latilactobacillus curvatus]|uniref:O-antigen ligase family protein n=1 Tax=Latilactobacillus curvatus TaxID=28038 RepID=UPI000FECACB9|nr:O-antigen ligase family protein [Latilactobacillus curvatus]QAR34956.1 glycosyltransferase [Latilactobacillus curvatus]